MIIGDKLMNQLMHRSCRKGSGGEWGDGALASSRALE